jgi:large subunit ribosomal protein L17
MRHGKKHNHLGRQTAHRKAMLSNMATSLLMHKRINTTVEKAKALRVYVEPILTKSKTDSTHSRREVFKHLQNKDIVTELFRDIAPKIADRPGGYTRIIRLGNRLGDNAEMCMIELVDFNELYSNDGAKKTTRRSRRGGSGAKKTEDTATTEETVEEVETATEVKAEEAVAEEVVAEEAKADDLTKVEGIGPKIAETLSAAGISTFAELAASTPEKIAEIITDVKGGHTPESWPAQAKMAAEGQWDELKKWQDEMDGGRIYHDRLTVGLLPTGPIS